MPRVPPPEGHQWATDERFTIGCVGQRAAAGGPVGADEFACCGGGGDAGDGLAAARPRALRRRRARARARLAEPVPTPPAKERRTRARRLERRRPARSARVAERVGSRTGQWRYGRAGAFGAWQRRAHRASRAAAPICGRPPADRRVRFAISQSEARRALDSLWFPDVRNTSAVMYQRALWPHLPFQLH